MTESASACWKTAGEKDHPNGRRTYVNAIPSTRKPSHPLMHGGTATDLKAPFKSNLTAQCLPARARSVAVDSPKPTGRFNRKLTGRRSTHIRPLPLEKDHEQNAREAERGGRISRAPDERSSRMAVTIASNSASSQDSEVALRPPGGGMTAVPPGNIAAALKRGWQGMGGRTRIGGRT